MPTFRQDEAGPGSAPERPNEADLIVRSLGLGLAPDSEVDTHVHPWHQLVYATCGVMVVTSMEGRWVVPPERAVWIPAGLAHSVRARGAVTMQTVYLNPAWWGTGQGEPAQLLSQPWVVHVTPLLKELVLEVLRCGMLAESIAKEVRLAEVLRDQIQSMRSVPFALPLPRDARALRVVDALARDVRARVTLAVLAEGSGASARTIERLFLDETGLTFGRWLQRARALHALELLGAGASVTEAGLSVGYDSTSAFIAMFKKVTGSTPGAYLGHPKNS